MRLGRRQTPAATYAAIVGDRWLWVALTGPATVSLQGPDGPLEVPAELDDGQPGHHGVRLDLAALPARELRLALHAGRAALAAAPVRPQGPGTTFALERDEATHLHVVRRWGPAAVGVVPALMVDKTRLSSNQSGDYAATVRALRLVGEQVEIDLDGTGDHGSLDLVDGEALVATLPLVGATATLRPADLATAVPGQPPLRALVGGVPVRRRANDLVDPGGGALLPAVHPAGAETALARLRWAPDATLTVRVLR